MGHPRKLAAFWKHALVRVELHIEYRHRRALNPRLHRRVLLFWEVYKQWAKLYSRKIRFPVKIEPTVRHSAFPASPFLKYHLPLTARLPAKNRVLEEVLVIALRIVIAEVRAAALGAS